MLLCFLDQLHDRSAILFSWWNKREISKMAICSEVLETQTVIQHARNQSLSVTLCPAMTCVIVFRKWEGCFNAVLFIHILLFYCQALEFMEQIILCFHWGSEKLEHNWSHFPVFNYRSKYNTYSRINFLLKWVPFGKMFICQIQDINFRINFSHSHFFMFFNTPNMFFSWPDKSCVLLLTQIWLRQNQNACNIWCGPS